MRLVAVSIVKNEADIIEAFVRHTAYWVDHHLIFDHDSTDGTREILAALREELLPLTLYTDDDWAHRQQLRSNHLTRLAAHEFEADWIIPLDTDEILIGPSRASLEEQLGSSEVKTPRSLRLRNYYPSANDNSDEINPVRRLRYCQPSLSHTKKLLIPKDLAVDEAIIAVKGSHSLQRGTKILRDEPLPEAFHLAHLPLRSSQHQALRVIMAELQKLSSGKAGEGLDMHYRLGYQLLAENPELFFATICASEKQLSLEPITYHGTDLRYSAASAGWHRVAKALLPFLEHLASSHGRLLDGDSDSVRSTGIIREIPPAEIPQSMQTSGREKFSGFSPQDGWGPVEGPIPEAFLPHFHWAHYPSTQLSINSEEAKTVILHADILTYTENQTMSIHLNGTAINTVHFPRINQKESLCIKLPLNIGHNELSFRYSHYLATDYDPRRLAVLFLSLKITSAASLS